MVTAKAFCQNCRKELDVVADENLIMHLIDPETHLEHSCPIQEGSDIPDPMDIWWSKRWIQW